MLNLTCQRYIITNGRKEGKSMNQKQILNDALNHKSGRVPFDLGATTVSGAHVSCVENLRNFYGLENRPVKVFEPYQMLGLIEDDLQKAMGIDTVGVFTPSTMFGFTNHDWKEWKTPWEQTVLISEDFNITQKGNDIFVHPEGDLSVPPSAHMPEGGFFFDAIIRQEPIVESELNPEDNLEEFGPIEESTLTYFKEEVGKATATGRGVVATFGGTAFGDIALVPATFLRNPKGIRDVTEWYISTAMRQDYIQAVFSKQLELALANLEKIYKTIGNKIDVIFICGTDFGTQQGTFCSPETFDHLWLPYYREVNDWIHKNTGWKTFKHSCGAVESFMSHFIKAGFDIINPVQYSAKGMDTSNLKEQYGRDLVFWGGGVDTQKILPFSTPEDVRNHVLKQCETLSSDGGFVFNQVHNIQAKTPTENIVAMVNALTEFNS